MDKEELRKEATATIEWECTPMINRPTFVNGYITGAESKGKRIEELEKELKAEKELNAEIKVRFVKCNTCTPEMKEKCLMFNENLCEGERCEELVDLISLVNKRDTDDKVKELEAQIDKMKCCYNCSKWYDGECEESPKSKTFFCADFRCDKWELDK